MPGGYVSGQFVELGFKAGVCIAVIFLGLIYGSVWVELAGSVPGIRRAVRACVPLTVHLMPWGYRFSANAGNTCASSWSSRVALASSMSHRWLNM